MSITYHKGDLFEHLPKDKTIYIPHVCNNAGGWGAGFVLALSKHFPRAEKSYREWFEYGKPDLSNVQMVPIPQTRNIIVCNMIAQGLGGIKPLRYGHLAHCMQKVADTLQPGFLIYAPKFGSGLAGGDWAIIEELIEDIWGKNEVHIFTL